MMPTATTHRLGALSFVVTFHAPFHVGSGVASRGLDRVIDRENPLPATGLKGVMRAAAAETLVLPTGLVTEVFGGPGGAACPWWWSDARFIPQETSIDRLARIRVDETTGTVQRGFLMMGEVVWSSQADFNVTLSDDRDEATIARHELILRAAARAVVAVGGARRRGEGWVTITDQAPWGADESRALLEMKAAS